ncbi:MAG: hypothetical protein H6Q28_812, partial [Bacteroidetes bacterium]|nr:hypothetical protein [Bacteroidota bacterium]
GMGVVYLAEDTRLHRKVALKFLPRELSSSPEDRERLKVEARLAASLNHPNVATIYAIEEVGDELFLAMEYLPGLDLKETIRQDSWSHVPFEQKVGYALQIAEGIGAAHRRGIIHRDIKTSNIVVTADGKAKILDFGIARPQESARKTSKGQTPGTVAYMSPEQARGERLDFRTDIWSYGVVLFELFTGQLPFVGKFDQAVYYSILHEKPKPLRRLLPALPEELESIVERTLEKDPSRRIQTMEEVLELLRSVPASGAEPRGRSPLQRLLSLPPARRRLVGGMALGAVVMVAIAAWLTGNLPHAPSVSEINDRLSDMVSAGDYAAAYALAVEHEARLQGDSSFASLQLLMFDTLTVRSVPAGGTVVLRRLDPGASRVSADTLLLGPTPQENVRVGRGEYLLTIRKPGYYPADRLASSTPIPPLLPLVRRGIVVDVQLVDTAAAPPFMARVPAGTYQLADWSIRGKEEVQLDDFLVDEREVSNEEYRAFVRAGGYVKREFWKHHIIVDGKPMPWEQAMRTLVDQTHLPGPRGWMGQSYPDGKGDHPVTGITWYEAAAFAEFAGKSLPTVYQWEKAARNGIPNLMGIVMPWGLVQDTSGNFRNRANFETDGTTPVSRYRTGMSPFGCLNMAGNVREWLDTETSRGRLVAGGSWKDPYYLFSRYAGFPQGLASDDLGFRCVLNRDGTARKGPPAVDLHRETPTYRPDRSIDFAALAGFYNYDRGPLTILSSSIEETPEWRKEKVAFSGSDGEEIVAYLFLPKLAQAPYQCIVFDPHSGVYAGIVQADWAAEVILGPHIRSGRAVLAIVPKGSLQRPWSSREGFPPRSSVLYRDRVVRWVRDNRIGIDYLGSRGDIDMHRVALVVLSNEGGPLLVPALDTRYRSVALVACGLDPDVNDNRPETNPINFLPHYSAPTLVLNGTYDEVFPTEQCAIPLYNLLPEPKKLELLNSGHAPPLGQRVPVINRWLDETMGQVQFPR